MKQQFIVGLVIVIGVIFVSALYYVGPNRIGRVPAAPLLAVQVKPEVAFLLDEGDGNVATVSTAAKNPLEALLLVADAKGEQVTVKSYDFGSLVQKVGNHENSSTKAWIYFVNGKSGEVAADKYELKSGDSVEWKYTEVK